MASNQGRGGAIWKQCRGGKEESDSHFTGRSELKRQYQQLGRSLGEAVASGDSQVKEEGEDTMLSEISTRERDKNHKISLIC